MAGPVNGGGHACWRTTSKTRVRSVWDPWQPLCAPWRFRDLALQWPRRNGFLSVLHGRRALAPLLGLSRRRHRVDHRGYQRQCGAVRAVPAGFRSLRDVDVRARGLGSAPAFQVLYLADQRAPCLLDGGGKRTWITEREHECVRLVAQGEIKDLPRSVPGDQPHAPGTLCLAPGFGELGAQAVEVAVTAAAQPQRTGVGYCRSQMV